jgi:hypothetical protein
MANERTEVVHASRSSASRHTGSGGAVRSKLSGSIAGAIAPQISILGVKDGQT